MSYKSRLAVIGTLLVTATLVGVEAGKLPGAPAAAFAAARPRLSCTLAPRTLPAGGGTVTFTVDGTRAGATDTMVAEITRPDGGVTTLDLAASTEGHYSGVFNVPANPGRGSQRYAVEMLASGGSGAGLSQKCGVFRVQPRTGTLPLTLSACQATPRHLPPSGGPVRFEVQVTGGAPDVEVAATIDGPLLHQEVPLTRGRKNLYSGTFTFPSVEVSGVAYAITLHAQDSSETSTEADCGIVTIANNQVGGGIAVVQASDAGRSAQVLTFQGGTLTPGASFQAVDPAFQGGVRVAVGDVDGDGKPDFVLGTGPGAAAHVRVFRGTDFSEYTAFAPFESSFVGGVRVAAGDVNGDGTADIIVGAGPGSAGGHVKVFDGHTGAELSSFFPFAPTFRGGVSVAAGDVNGDGKADVIVGAGPGGGSQVRVFSGLTQTVLASFNAFATGFAGGVFVAAGDLNGDGRAEIITGAGAGASPQVSVFNVRGGTLLQSFFAFEPTFQGGVFVAAGDVDGDGHPDVITGSGPGAAGGRVRVFDGVTGTLVQTVQPYPTEYTGGIEVTSLR